ncbi:hypothetical protein [Maricaulis sp.]|uniref:hypothetical protein n=1 Tax=Maricaulis sp. TaxID=1486257 RepID=UPI003A93294C
MKFGRVFVADICGIPHFMCQNLDDYSASTKGLGQNFGINYSDKHLKMAAKMGAMGAFYYSLVGRRYYSALTILSRGAVLPVSCLSEFCRACGSEMYYLSVPHLDYLSERGNCREDTHQHLSSLLQHQSCKCGARTPFMVIAVCNE